MQQVGDLVHERTQSAAEVEILHEESPCRTDVCQQWSAPGNHVEFVEFNLDACAAGHGDDVHDGIGRTTDGHVDCNPVLDGLPGENLGGLQVVPDVFNRLASGLRRHSLVAGVGSGDR